METFYQEPDHTIYCGHALDVLPSLPSESIDCVPTSPPYWGLRSYKTEPLIWDDHNGCVHTWGSTIDKISSGGGGYKQDTNVGAWFKAGSNFCTKCGAWRGELGLEPTIELYITHLLQIFDEIRRVLKKSGTVWVNIGDTYSGSGQDSGKQPGAQRCGDTGIDHRSVDIVGTGRPVTVGVRNVSAKSLCLIPERFAIGMVERGWILRNVIVWYKGNPMPESVTDRFTGSYEYVYFFVKSRRYWFEQQFEAVQPSTIIRYNYLNDGGRQKLSYGDDLHISRINPIIERPGHKDMLLARGRNKRDVWEINVHPYPEAHFATFPQELIEPPVLSGCPPMICRNCGQAREPIYERRRIPRDELDMADERYRPNTYMGAYGDINGKADAGYTDVSLKGYTDCGCNAGFDGGVVLDPFTGSGTAQAVAKRLGRKSIGIELNPNYCKLAARRLQEIPLAMPLLAS